MNEDDSGMYDNEDSVSQKWDRTGNHNIDFHAFLSYITDKAGTL